MYLILRATSIFISLILHAFSIAPSKTKKPNCLAAVSQKQHTTCNNLIIYSWPEIFFFVILNQCKLCVIFMGTIAWFIQYFTSCHLHATYYYTTTYYNTIKFPSKLILTARLHTINRNNNYGTITLHPVITSKNIRYTGRVYRT